MDSSLLSKQPSVPVLRLHCTSLMLSLSHLLQAEAKDEAEKPSESAEKPTEAEKEKNETTEKSEPQEEEESEGGESKTAGTDTDCQSCTECSWACRNLTSLLHAFHCMNFVIKWAEFNSYHITAHCDEKRMMFGEGKNFGPSNPGLNYG